jgi:hypothetical protein
VIIIHLVIQGQIGRFSVRHNFIKVQNKPYSLQNREASYQAGWCRAWLFINQYYTTVVIYINWFWSAVTLTVTCAADAARHSSMPPVLQSGRTGTRGLVPDLYWFDCIKFPDIKRQNVPEKSKRSMFWKHVVRCALKVESIECRRKVSLARICMTVERWRWPCSGGDNPVTLELLGWPKIRRCHVTLLTQRPSRAAAYGSWPCEWYCDDSIHNMQPRFCSRRG